LRLWPEVTVVQDLGHSYGKALGPGAVIGNTVAIGARGLPRWCAAPQAPSSARLIPM